MVAEAPASVSHYLIFSQARQDLASAPGGWEAPNSQVPAKSDPSIFLSSPPRVPRTSGFCPPAPVAGMIKERSKASQGHLCLFRLLTALLCWGPLNAGWSACEAWGCSAGTHNISWDSYILTSFKTRRKQCTIQTAVYLSLCWCNREASEQLLPSW